MMPARVNLNLLGCATNKYIKFVADTGSPVSIVPHSVVIRNKLKILPTDEDEPSYAGVSGMKLSVVGHCHICTSVSRR